MKILLTGGGTGGHFYPLIAIAEKLNELADKEKIIDMKLYYMSDKPYDKRMLFENNINYIQVPAGKMRLYFSFKNFLDIFSTAIGLIWGLLKVFSIYPDVIISKGGYSAFPAVFAGKIFKIPIIIHESDSYPGRLNVWASKFAQKIAVSYAEAGEYFPKEKTAWVGQPVRKEISQKATEGMFEFFKLDKNIPVILIIGGSQGAQKINDVVLNALPDLLNNYQIIHQVGIKNYNDVKLRAELILEKNSNKARYLIFPYLNNLETKMSAGASTLIISRAGSAIFEIASWGVPSIVIPITKSNGDHQRKNAFNYARAGACEVIEEENLTPHLLYSEIKKIVDNKERVEQMSHKALLFATPQASEKIAREAVNIALEHEG